MDAVDVTCALLDTRGAFDRVAPTYDRSNAENRTLCEMRARTLQALDHLVPRGARVRTSIRGTLEEILFGPAHENDGRMNLFGALRTSMATCGYETVKEFQKAEVMVAPALMTEGKTLQRSQGVGMGR